MHQRKRMGAPLRVVCINEEQITLVYEFHENIWVDHIGNWATFMKLKEKYQWPG